MREKQERGRDQISRHRALPYSNGWIFSSSIAKAFPVLSDEPAAAVGMIQTFGDELRGEGIDAAELARQTENNLEGLQPVRTKVWENWSVSRIV